MVTNKRSQSEKFVMATDKSDDQFGIIRELMAMPENQVCFDCKAKNPTWAEIWHGVFICDDCSDAHDSLDKEVSIVRSTNFFESWNDGHLRMMRFGGNKNAQVFFDRHGWTDGGTAKYTSRAAELYRDSILDKVVSSLSEEEIEALKEFRIQKYKNTGGLGEDPGVSAKEPIGAKMTGNTDGFGVPQLTPEIQETDEARRKFPNAKSISSAQYFGQQEKMDDTEAKLRLQKFATSTAISSADLFGHKVDNPPIFSISTANYSADHFEHEEFWGDNFTAEFHKLADEDYQLLQETVEEYKNSIGSYVSRLVRGLCNKLTV